MCRHFARCKLTAVSYSTHRYVYRVLQLKMRKLCWEKKLLLRVIFFHSFCACKWKENWLYYICTDGTVEYCCWHNAHLFSGEASSGLYSVTTKELRKQSMLILWFILLFSSHCSVGWTFATNFGCDRIDENELQKCQIHSIEMVTTKSYCVHYFIIFS